MPMPVSAARERADKAPAADNAPDMVTVVQTLPTVAVVLKLVLGSGFLVRALGRIAAVSGRLAFCFLPHARGTAAAKVCFADHRFVLLLWSLWSGEPFLRVAATAFAGCLHPHAQRGTPSPSSCYLAQRRRRTLGDAPARL